MRVCVTGATGFIGAHVTKLAAEADGPPRVTYRDEARLDRLGDVEVEPVKADVLDRGALRRAFRGCELVFHAAGLVALASAGAGLADERAGAPDRRRGGGGRGRAARGRDLERCRDRPGAADRPGTEEDIYRGWGLGLTYPDAKHEGEAEALAAGARLGVEVIVTNPSYVFGAPVERSQPGETSTRMIGNYLRGRLPAVVDARDKRRRRARRGQGPPARRRARAAGRALRARRPRRRLGGAAGARRRAVRGSTTR